MPWPELSDNFETNLAAMSVPDEVAADLRGATRQVQLFRAIDGSLHLSQRGRSGVREWLPGLADPSRLEVATDHGEELPTWLVHGLPLGDFVERLLDSTTRDAGQPQQPLYLIETRWPNLAAWLHERDRSSMLADERVMLFAGPDAESKLTTLLRESIDLPLPTRLSAPYSDDETVTRLQTLCRNAADDRSATHRGCVARIEAREAPPLAPGATIVGFTSRYTTMLQHSMRDIGFALESLGYDMQIVMEAAPHRQMNGALLSDVIDRHDPALIVLINHLRYEGGVAYGHVPMLTWIQDPMPKLLCPEAGASIGPRDFVCGFYRNRCVGELGYPADRFFSSVVPLSTRVFHDAPLPPEHADAECDVMYVGHLHATVEEHLADWHARTPPPLRPVIDRLERTVRSMHAERDHIQDARPLVDEAATAAGLALDPTLSENLTSYFTFRLYDILFRRETLHWVARWAEESGRVFRLYGRGWEKDPVLAPHAVGPVEHGEPLRCAYGGARLVLQTLPSGFMHQRTYEGLASGSLVISRLVPESFGRLSLDEFKRTPPEQLPPSTAALKFPGLERVMFDSAESLAALCDRYLADDDTRETVAAEMRDVVLSEFTYTRVLGDVLEQMQSLLSGHASPKS
jgi:hypothetical protein